MGGWVDGQIDSHKYRYRCVSIDIGPTGKKNVCTMFIENA